MDEGEKEAGDEQKTSIRRQWNILIQELFLILLVIVYILVGAVIFRILERPTDVLERQELIDDLEWTISKLYELSYDDEITEERWSQEFVARIDDLSPKMCNKKIWFDVEARQPVSNWADLSIVSSFCFALITTTPTGEMQPATYNGKAFFILFCVVGIPLALLTLRELGIHFTAALQIIILYLKYWYYGIRYTNNKDRGRTSPATRWNRFVHKISSMTIAQGSRPLPGTSVEAYPKVRPKEPLPRNWRDVQVPSALVISIWLIYLLNLAILMSFYEEWKYLEALYFTVMTLITCPMGDFIPRVIPKWLYSICIAIGLVIFSLCFNVCYDRIIEGMLGLFKIRKFEELKKAQKEEKEEDEKDEPPEQSFFEKLLFS